MACIPGLEWVTGVETKALLKSFVLCLHIYYTFNALNPRRGINKGPEKLYLSEGIDRHSYSTFTPIGSESRSACPGD